MFDFIKNNSIALVAIVVAGIALFAGSNPVTDTLGVSETTTFTNPIVFDQTVTVGGALAINAAATVDEFTQGGGCTTLTDANGGTYTLTEAQLLASNCFEFAAGGAGQATIALTLPATSTMTTLLASSGDFREWVYDASALAAATTTTVTAGTGIDLIAVTTNDDVIDGAEYARISCWRKADTDVACITSELLNAD